MADVRKASPPLFMFVATQSTSRCDTSFSSFNITRVAMIPGVLRTEMMAMRKASGHTGWSKRSFLAN